jgi:hypothetical protein
MPAQVQMTTGTLPFHQSLLPQEDYPEQGVQTGLLIFPALSG